MLIAVGSPRRYQGQTVTAINTAAMMAEIEKKRVLLIDLNSRYRDMARYLSEAQVPKGIDDFVSLYNSGLLNTDSLKQCVDETKFGLDIMNSNKCTHLEEVHIDAILDIADKIYDYVVVDLDGAHKAHIIRASDLLIAVIGTNKEVVESLPDYLKGVEDKSLIAVNRYAEKVNGIKVNNYINRKRCPIKTLMKIETLYLELDAHLQNSCNESRILHYITSKQGSKYSKEMKKLIRLIER